MNIKSFISTNKYTLVIITVLLPLIILKTAPLYAQTQDENIPKKLSPTPSVSEVIDKLKQIEKLKEKIATKVAEIRQREQTAVKGNVKKSSSSNIIINSTKGDKTILYSEDTIFYSLSFGKRSLFTSNKINIDDTLLAFGYQGDEKNSISAKYIYKIEQYLRIEGKITNINSNNYSLNIKGSAGETTVDYEKSTRSYRYDERQKDFIKGGFSKLKVGDHIHVVAATGREEGRASAQKIYAISFGKELQNSSSPTP